jgi:nucleoid-associated protein YgaU
MKSVPTAVQAIALAVLTVACAPKEEVKPTAAPLPATTPQAAAPVQQPLDASNSAPSRSIAGADSVAKHYVVRKGDNLWAIAARSSVLGDPMEWPLLYRANRDSITDPDLIEVDQDLSYASDDDRTTIATAVKEAGETPPYVAHSSPRKTLAINY